MKQAFPRLVWTEIMSEATLKRLSRRKGSWGFWPCFRKYPLSCRTLHHHIWNLQAFTLERCCQTSTVGCFQVHRKCPHWIMHLDWQRWPCRWISEILFSHPLAFRECLPSNSSQIMACLTPHHLLCSCACVCGREGEKCVFRRKAEREVWWLWVYFDHRSDLILWDNARVHTPAQSAAFSLHLLLPPIQLRTYWAAITVLIGRLQNGQHRDLT